MWIVIRDRKLTWNYCQCILTIKMQIYTVFAYSHWRKCFHLTRIVFCKASSIHFLQGIITSQNFTSVAFSLNLVAHPLPRQWPLHTHTSIAISCSICRKPSTSSRASCTSVAFSLSLVASSTMCSRARPRLSCLRWSSSVLLTLVGSSSGMGSLMRKKNSNKSSKFNHFYSAYNSIIAFILFSTFNTT